MEGINIFDLFLFSTDLESVGLWNRQLVAESLGKEFNLEGDRVNVGLTPTVSIGSTDLHSMAQLIWVDLMIDSQHLSLLIRTIVRSQSQAQLGILDLYLGCREERWMTYSTQYVRVQRMPSGTIIDLSWR